MLVKVVKSLCLHIFLLIIPLTCLIYSKSDYLNTTPSFVLDNVLGFRKTVSLASIYFSDINVYITFVMPNVTTLLVSFCSFTLTPNAMPNLPASAILFVIAKIAK